MATSNAEMLTKLKLSEIEEQIKTIQNFLRQGATKTQLLGYGFREEEIAKAQKQSDVPAVAPFVYNVQINLPKSDSAPEGSLISELNLSPLSPPQLQDKMGEERQLEEQLRKSLSQLALGENGIPYVEVDAEDLAGEFEVVAPVTMGNKPLIFSSDPSSVGVGLLTEGQSESVQNKKEEGKEKIEATKQKTRWLGFW